MKKTVFFTAIFIIVVLTPRIGTAQDDEKAIDGCSVGPVLKQFGNSSWNVYSCPETETLMIVSAPGSPAMPFYFALYIKDGVRKLHGEGTGANEATAAAFDEIKILADSEDMIHALIAETVKVDQIQ